ncbi:MAG: hypothetical protein Q4G43_08730, partial [Mobilicoccus sp.]|nr:hypothetical protein [Mobilicoccus sp.]
MTIDRPDSGLRRSAPPVGPLTFDLREQTLADALRRHVLIRDACLAPSAAIVDKLESLEHVLDASGSGGILREIERARYEIIDMGSLLRVERRRLVVLDLLTGLPHTRSDMGWSRSPSDLVTEAAAGLGFGRGEIRRLTRAVVAARRAAPTVSVGPSPARALAETLRSVSTCSAGTAIASAVLLLSGAPVPAASRCGAVLVDPAGGSGTYLGTIVARHDLSAFIDDLTTLGVAADIDPTVRSYATTLLADLATELSGVDVPDTERPTLA